MGEGWRENLSAWADKRAEPEEFRAYWNRDRALEAANLRIDTAPSDCDTVDPWSS